jgi:hypothetical protein
MAQKFKGNVNVEGNLNLPNVTSGRALVIDGSGNVNDSAVTETELGRLSGVTSDIQDQLDDKINSSEKGANNGVATLDAGGKIPVAQLPNSVMEYLGAWNASTNSPTLADGSGNSGDVYRVSVAGTQDLGSGNITFDVADFVIYNGSIWQKSPGADAVVSVNGQQGVVVLDSDDISEGATNLYFTNERAQDAVGTILIDSTNIDLSYNDATNEISASILPGSIVNGDISSSAAIQLSKLEALINNRVLQSNGSGVITASSVSNTELGYLLGVTSSIQDQLDDKASNDLSNLITTSINQDLIPSANFTRSLGTTTLNYLRGFIGRTVSDTHQETGTITGDVTAGSDLVTNVTGDQTFFDQSALISGTGIPANVVAVRHSATTFRIVNFSDIPTNATATNTGVTITWSTLSFGAALSSLAKPTTGASGGVFISSGRTVDNASGSLTINTGMSFRSSGAGTGGIIIASGRANNESGTATTGGIQVRSGLSFGTGTTGTTAISTGNANSTGNTGTVSSVSGTVSSGTSGDNSISTGTSTTGATGQTLISTGNSSSAGTTGNVTISTGTTSGTRGNVDITGGSVNINAATTNGNILLVPNGTGVVDVSNKKIVQVATPTSGTDAANKDYVDTTTQPLDSDLTALAGLATTGLIVRSGSGTAETRTITASSAISVSNGDGVSGNPTISVDINGTTAETVANNADAILIYDDSASANRKMTRANFLAGIPISSAGDIAESSFSVANNQVSAANVTSFAFANATVRSFEALVSVYVNATTSLYETFKIQGIQKGASWDIAVSSVGDNSQVNFTITNAGQIQYTSGSYAGFVSATMKFRAITTSV